MNRHYTVGEYYTSVEYLRKYFDQPAITTDIIVGFPGETEAEFAETAAFLDKVCFYEMHIFKFSKRAGTVAASMPEQVPDRIKNHRSNILQDMEKRQSAKFRQRYIGGEAEVLLEETKNIQGGVYLLGHTKDYVKLAILQSGFETGPGRLETVAVKDFLTDEILLAELPKE